MKSEDRNKQLAEIAQKLTKLYSLLGEKRLEMLKTVSHEKKSIIGKEISQITKEIESLEKTFDQHFGTEQG